MQNRNRHRREAEYILGERGQTACSLAVTEVMKLVSFLDFNLMADGRLPTMVSAVIMHVQIMPATRCTDGSYAPAFSAGRHAENIDDVIQIMHTAATVARIVRTMIRKENGGMILPCSREMMGIDSGGDGGAAVFQGETVDDGGLERKLSRERRK